MMNSLCGCVAKVRQCIGFNDRLVDASGLRKNRNSSFKMKNKIAWEYKQNKQSLKNIKRAVSTMLPSYSTPALPDSTTRQLLKAQSKCFAKELTQKVKEAQKIQTHDQRQVQDLMRRKVGHSSGFLKNKISFTYKNKNNRSLEELEEKFIQNSLQIQSISHRKQNNSFEGQINKSSISVDDKIRVLEKRFSQQEKKIERNDSQIQNNSVSEYEKNSFSKEKNNMEYFRAEEYIERFEIKEEFLVDKDKLKEKNNLQPNNGTFHQIYQSSAENHESQFQIPTIQIFPQQQISIDYKQEGNQHIQQNIPTFRDNEQRKALSSLYDDMSFLKSIQDDQSSDAFSEVVERSAYNILSEGNLTPEHSEIIQSKPKCFVSLKLSHEKGNKEYFIIS